MVQRNSGIRVTLASATTHRWPHVYLFEPVSENADFGIFLVRNEEYSVHCGHRVIALSTDSIELGWVKRQTSETRVGIDAPYGFTKAFAKWGG